MAYETVLITGGAGFVGSTLAIAIRHAHPGTSVIAFDNLHRRGSEMNLPRLKRAGARFVHGDVRSLADLAGIRPAPDLIVECSAEPSVLAGYGGSPEYLIQTNLTGCFHCLEIARQAKGPSKIKMNNGEPRISGPCLLQQSDRVVNLTQKQMTQAQY